LFVPAPTFAEETLVVAVTPGDGIATRAVVSWPHARLRLLFAARSDEEQQLLVPGLEWGPLIAGPLTPAGGLTAVANPHSGGASGDSWLVATGARLDASLVPSSRLGIATNLGPSVFPFGWIYQGTATVGLVLAVRTSEPADRPTDAGTLTGTPFSAFAEAGILHSVSADGDDTAALPDGWFNDPPDADALSHVFARSVVRSASVGAGAAAALSLPVRELPGFWTRIHARLHLVAGWEVTGRTVLVSPGYRTPDGRLIATGLRPGLHSAVRGRWGSVAGGVERRYVAAHEHYRAVGFPWDQIRFGEDRYTARVVVRTPGNDAFLRSMTLDATALLTSDPAWRVAVEAALVKAAVVTPALAASSRTTGTLALALRLNPGVSIDQDGEPVVRLRSELEVGDGVSRAIAPGASVTLSATTRWEPLSSQWELEWRILFRAERTHERADATAPE